MPPLSLEEDALLGEVGGPRSPPARPERSSAPPPLPPPRRALDPARFEGPREVELPGGIDLDLEVDLPSPVDLELPSPLDNLPAPVDLDLPAPADLDLPAPADLNLLAPVHLDLPTPAELLPTPVDDSLQPAEFLPAPAENLPAPAENLPIPVDEQGPDVARVDDVDLDLDVDVDVGTAARPARRPANLVDAHEDAKRPAKRVPAQPQAAGSPAPKTSAGVSRVVVYGGLAAVLLVGGGAAAYVAGVFDGDVSLPVVPPDEATKGPAKVPAGEVAERSEAVLAKLDEDSPAAYQQAMALSEQASDHVGRAEAALLMHLRYGPDGTLAGQARGWLEPYSDRQEPFVRRVLGLAALTAGDTQAAAAALADDDPRSHLYRSWLARRRGDATEAAAQAKLAVQGRPNDKAARLSNLVLDVERDPVAGLEALRAAAQQDPEHALLQRELVEVLLAQGRLADAHAHAEKLQSPAAAAAGYKAALLALRAQIATARGDQAAALRLYEQAASLGPEADAAKLARLEVLLGYGDFSGVRKDLETMLHAKPDLVRGQLLMAQLAIATGEGDQALAALAKIADKIPKDPRVPDLRGQVLAMRMKTDEAQAAFAKARELDPTFARATIDEAQLLAKLDRGEEAIALLEAQRASLESNESLAARKSAGALSRAKAELLRAGGQGEAALAALDAALALDSNDNDANLARAGLLQTLGRIEEAETAYLALHERTGGYPGLTSPLGRVYLRKKDLDKLEQLLGNQLDDAQAPDDILLTGARLRLQQDKPDLARGLVDRVMARSPDNWEGQLVKCQILIRQGDYDGALMAIEQARPRQPNGEVELWTGQANEYVGDAKQAMTHYARALELDPTLDEAAALYGRLLAYSGAAKQAIDLLQPVVTRTDDFPYAYAALGRAMYDLGKHKEAVEGFQTAYRLDPKLFEAYYWEGRIQGDRNQHAAAVKALAGGVAVAGENEPYLPDAYRRLGDAHRSLDHKAEARAAYEKYLEVAPPDGPGRAAVQRLLDTL